MLALLVHRGRAGMTRAGIGAALVSFWLSDLLLTRWREHVSIKVPSDDAWHCTKYLSDVTTQQAPDWMHSDVQRDKEVPGELSETWRPRCGGV
jgi:hypothetical protein